MVTRKKANLETEDTKTGGKTRLGRTVRLVLSEDGSAFIPVDEKSLPTRVGNLGTIPVPRGATDIALKSDPLVGLTVGSAVFPAPNLTDYAVPVSVYGNPNIKPFESSDGSKIYIDAPISVLAQYNEMYKPISVSLPDKYPLGGIDAVTELTQRVRGVEPKQEIVPIDPQSVEGKIKNYLSQQLNSEQPEVDFSAKYYTYEQLMELPSGIEVADPLNPSGSALFKFFLPNPDVPELDGQPQDAVILPASFMGRSSSFSGEYYYIAPVNVAVNDIIKNKVAENKLGDLKQSLLNAGFLTPEQYNTSVSGVNREIADTATKAGVAQALASLSVNSYERLSSGDKNIFDVDDWLLVNQDRSRTVSSVAVPGSGELKTLQDSIYERYMGRKATEEEFANFQQQVTQSAIENAQRTTTQLTPSGEAMDVVTGGFTSGDITRLAESMTVGTEEREQYYGAKRLNNLMMQAFRQDFGSGQKSLEQLLR
jgi:hypothetical protein